jgi:hypothetical protein
LTEGRGGTEAAKTLEGGYIVALHMRNLEVAGSEVRAVRTRYLAPTSVFAEAVPSRRRKPQKVGIVEAVLAVQMAAAPRLGEVLLSSGSVELG